MRGADTHSLRLLVVAPVLPNSCKPRRSREAIAATGASSRFGLPAPSVMDLLRWKTPAGRCLTTSSTRQPDEVQNETAIMPQTHLSESADEHHSEDESIIFPCRCQIWHQAGGVNILHATPA